MAFCRPTTLGNGARQRYWTGSSTSADRPPHLRRGHQHGPRRRRQGYAHANRGPVPARLRQRHGDQAAFEVDGTTMAVTTDSYVVSPIFFPGGDHRDLLYSEIGPRVQPGRLQDMVERCPPARSPGQDRTDAAPECPVPGIELLPRAQVVYAAARGYSSAASVSESKRCSVRVSRPSFTSSPTLTSMRGSTRAVIVASPTRP